MNTHAERYAYILSVCVDYLRAHPYTVDPDTDESLMDMEQQEITAIQRVAEEGLRAAQETPWSTPT